ncbi:MAG: LD-carboxypeptidase [Lentisphaeria bacterium]|nr:LD-carboxypeptidase [Lentisphaeria bacterium]
MKEELTGKTAKTLLAGICAAGSVCMAAPVPDAESGSEKEWSGADMDRLKGVFPASIKTIAVLTPASVPNAAVIRKGIAMLERAGIKVKVMPHTFDQPAKGKKALPIKSRLDDLNQAIRDMEVDMILPTRGGTGAQQLIDKMDWRTFKKRPGLILMGFSNITCLTGAMESKGAGRPIQGPNLGRLVSVDKASLTHLKAVLARKTPPKVKLHPLREGDVRGRVYAGHLALLREVVSRNFIVNTAGRVIFIECVRRPEAELREHFDYLLKAGFFEGAAGVVFCHFTRNFPTEEAKMQFFREMTAKLSCPVYYGYPYGHENTMRALDFSCTAAIKGNTLSLEFPPAE